jgi:hypothetical protein
MTEKQRGTADVTVVAWVDGQEALAYLVRRFALRARQTGTLALSEPITQEVPAGSGLYVWLRYRHTCKNQGNHRWDAQRFFARAMRDGSYRGHLYRADLNSWESAA